MGHEMDGRWLDPNAVQTETFFWGGIIMAVAVAGFVTIMIFKRYWKRAEAQTQEAGFSLADLRAMRDRGRSRRRSMSRRGRM